MKNANVNITGCQAGDPKGLKALSIRQPWATLVMQGAKTMEIRSWKPVNMVFPETLLIHAGKKPDLEAIKRFEFPHKPARRRHSGAGRDDRHYPI